MNHPDWTKDFRDKYYLDAIYLVNHLLVVKNSPAKRHYIVAYYMSILLVK